MMLFDRGVPENRRLGGIGVSEPSHFNAVYTEYMVENVLSMS
jgi:hypothetical protein